MLGDLVAGLAVSKYLIITAIVIMYIILGCFLDIYACIMLTVPIIYPVIIGLGFDPIWFGVIIILVVSMGVITPPIGLNVYVIKGVASEVPMETIFKGVWPFVIAILVCIFLLIAFPQIATFLPNLFFRN